MHLACHAGVMTGRWRETLQHRRPRGVLRRRAWRWALLLSLLAVGGCGLLPGSAPVVRLDNLTNEAAAVEVNGAWLGTYAPRTSTDIPLQGRGAPPYLVSVRLANGQELTSMELTAEDVRVAADGSGGVAVTAELACGTVRLSIGRVDEALPTVSFAELPPCS